MKYISNVIAAGSINKLHSNLALVTITVAASILSACGGGTLRSDPRHVEDYRTFKVERIDENKYFVAFKGTPLTTLEEARLEWDHKAKQVCGGVYQYLGENYNPEEYNEESGIARTTDNSASIGSACATTGALGCIIASFIIGDFGNKEYPIINGTVACKPGSTPDEELANTSGHESIPHPPPDGCVWIRDSKIQKYELDC